MFRARPSSDRTAGLAAWRRAAKLAAVFGILLASAPVPGRADNGKPRLFTNQEYLEDVTRDASLPLDDMKAMLAFVLGSLPDRVKVYPTENYYYFTFFHQGVRYAGNLRLDAKDRDEGKLHFAYFEDLQEWTTSPPLTYRVFDRADGVAVDKLERFVYRVTFGAKQVIFELNDLTGVAPPPEAIGPDEKYLGPVFDESGMRLFLLFNPTLKIFHYVLDETIRIADQLRPAASTNRILIGIRTGFAYYLDLRMNRKILIGVFDGNSKVNNQFDGPFDQLPDNFVEGDALRDAILIVDPSLAGLIDRVGGSLDGSGRYLIAPYMYYRSEEELLIFHQCATSKDIPRSAYNRCFVVDPMDYGSPPVLPLPFKELVQKAAEAQKAETKLPKGVDPKPRAKGK